MSKFGFIQFCFSNDFLVLFGSFEIYIPTLVLRRCHNNVDLSLKDMHAFNLYWSLSFKTGGGEFYTHIL